MRHHASPEKMAVMIEQAGSASGKLVETAQRMVEQRDYRARKQVLDFDDVMNLQRGIVYHYRNEVLAAEDARKLVHDLLGETVPARVEEFLEESDPRRPDLRPLAEWLMRCSRIGRLPPFPPSLFELWRARSSGRKLKLSSAALAGMVAPVISAQVAMMSVVQIIWPQAEPGLMTPGQRTKNGSR